MLPPSSPDPGWDRFHHAIDLFAARSGIPADQLAVMHPDDRYRLAVVWARAKLVADAERRLFREVPSDQPPRVRRPLISPYAVWAFTVAAVLFLFAACLGKFS